MEFWCDISRDSGPVGEIGSYPDVGIEDDEEALDGNIGGNDGPEAGCIPTWPIWPEEAHGGVGAF